MQQPSSPRADHVTAGAARSRMIRTVGTAALIGWAAVSTSILALDRLGGTDGQGSALVAQHMTALSADRDASAAEAADAQRRFAAALDQVSSMQGQLLTSEKRRRELEAGLGALQASLADARSETDQIRRQLAEATRAAGQTAPAAARLREASVTLDVLSGELRAAAEARAEATRRADEAVRTAEALTAERDEMVRRNKEIFAQLEDAVEMSVKPLDDMIAQVGLDSDKLLETVRQGYEGIGGPLTPMGYSTRGNAAISESEARANEVVVSLGKLSNYRIAVSKLPLAMPVKSAFRFTSPYGGRWGRMHEGIDLAGPVGTPIYSTGDGVVTFAGWQRGYGNVIKIKHAMGTETRYGHLSKIGVRVGQKVSRNSLIGAMGNTGRSTGPHLHYEVRVDGKAVNPMSFIKAAQNVF